MPESLSESNLVQSIKAGLALHSPNELMQCFLQLAAINIEKGQTQEGADVLAFLMWNEQTPRDIQEKATELWEDLARWICPVFCWMPKILGAKQRFKTS